MKSEQDAEKVAKEERAVKLEQWCARQSLLSGKAFQFTMVSGDASFRRYFRLTTTDESFIAVDAPPEKEDSRQFCKVAELFRKQDCDVPLVYATDFDAGFMLLSDLGDRLLLSEINENNATRFYEKALNELVKLQAAKIQGNELPPYDHEKLMEEMFLFQSWFLDAYLGISLSEHELELVKQSEELVAKTVASQRQVLVHRDFHSRNIMLINDDVAMIDFQDALIGPVTYDAVSLLKDCYVEWSDEKRKKWLNNYFEKLLQKNILLDMKFEEFYQDFEWMGLQRHLKVLGIFSRLSIRDGKHGYLKDLPLTFRYVEEALLRIRELDDFTKFFIKEVKPLFLEKQAKI